MVGNPRSSWRGTLQITMNLTADIQEIVRYIFQFLLRTENDETLNLIGYTSDKEKIKQYKLVIKPSRFFDADFYGAFTSMPFLPLKTLQDVPILFGEPRMEKIDDTLVIHADFIASAYFLVSRYEEMICPHVRDKHGRFIGKESIAYRAGFLHRPIVEEYGKILRHYAREAGLNIEEPPVKIAQIYLTTDVDKLAHYRNAKSTLKAVSRILFHRKNATTALKTYLGEIDTDPWYTYPWLFEKAGELKEAIPNTNINQIAFIKTGGGNLPEDQPLQNISSKDFQTFFEFCEKEEVKIGLHPSYQAGINPQLISSEKEKLEQVLKRPITFTRNHYLCNREPEDFNALIEAGFTDDFTMGYADVAGFRLGTCRPVKWIEPQTKKLMPLLLHPLTIMDNTLNDSRYMRLKTEEAFDYCQNLIEEVKKHNGELMLLWHNISVEKENGLYHRELYEKMMDYLKKEEQ